MESKAEHAILFASGEHLEFVKKEQNAIQAKLMIGLVAIVEHNLGFACQMEDGLTLAHARTKVFAHQAQHKH